MVHVTLHDLMESHSAQDAAQAADKSTIRPKDVLEAIKELEFEDFIPRLEIELEKYNTEQCNKRNTYRRQKREEKAAADVKAATQAAMSASDAARASSDLATSAVTAANGGLDSSVLSQTLDSSGYELEGAGDRSLATDVEMDFQDGDADGGGRPPSKKVRVSGGANGEGVRAVSALEDEGVEDEDGDEGEGMEEEEEEEGEGEEVEVEVEEEDEEEEGLREDPLEEAEGGEEDEDEVLDDGEESD
ncbi:MAG: hypothetical protein Q9165_004457 [Trypethelium subeluteriae]